MTAFVEFNEGGRGGTGGGATMALEKGSPAYLAIDRGISFGDTIECPVGSRRDGTAQRFLITAIGEYHVLGRGIAFNPSGRGWEAVDPEGPEELIGLGWIEDATRIG